MTLLVLPLAAPAAAIVDETQGSVLELIPGEIAQISAGGEHTCAVTTGGDAYCWGSNLFGKLGDGTIISRGIPARVVQGEGLAPGTVAQISAGSSQTCAVTTGGDAYCWGASGWATGDTTIIARSAPARVSEGEGLVPGTVAQISAGGAHTCAVTTGGDAYCWGSNGFGRLGDGTTTGRSTPVQVAEGEGLTPGSVAQISAGTDHTCAVTTGGDAYCWGRNEYGQLGDGTIINRHTPVQVAEGAGLIPGTVAQISAGGYRACAVTTGGEAYCWGRNQYGQLGDGTTTDRSTPVQVAEGAGLTPGSVAQISAGGLHACAATTGGEAYCWGSNSYGQLGEGATTGRSTPVQVAAGQGLTAGTVVQISAGGSHTCAMDIGGDAYCWGSNDFGRLGDGTTIDRSTPGRVLLLAVAPPNQPVIVAPTANYVFAQGERQDFTINAQDPNGLSYHGELTVRNALTDEVVAQLTTLPAPSGMDSTGTLLDALEPGTYTVRAVAVNTAGTRSASTTGAFGVASVIPIISATCDTGDAVFDGFLGETYARARSHQPDANTAQVCLRADGGSALSRMGGRLEVVTSSPSAPIAITSTPEACDGSDDGAIPREHLLISVGDPSSPTTGPAHARVRADLRRADNTLAVCVDALQQAVGPFTAGITLELPSLADIEVLRFVPDLNQAHVTPRTAWTGPSAACRDATSGVTRLLDATMFGTDLRLYTMQQANVTSVCVRADDDSDGGGGRLDVSSGSPGDLAPTVTPDTSPPAIGDAASPCRWHAFTIAFASAHYEDDLDGPALCARGPSLAVDLTVTPGTLDPPTVDWTKD